MPVSLLIALIALTVFCPCVQAQDVNAARLGVIYNIDEPDSRELASFYVAQRSIPPQNLVGIHLPTVNVIAPEVFTPIRDFALTRLPTNVQSLVLVWSRPYAVGCMSVTTAFAAGFRTAFCEPGCAKTALSPLFDSDGWLPADTVGWWPAMLLPTSDLVRARSLIERGAASDATRPPGTVYLVRTQDAARGVRAKGYADVETMFGSQVHVVELTTPVLHEVTDAMAYFTGAARVDELASIHFRPGAVADHLTSTGGVLFDGSQMSALAWLWQGATASYGSVSEPCNLLGKFPDPNIFLSHYLRGETVLQAYWKSVEMPGQGLFIGEPLARPYALPRR